MMRHLRLTTLVALFVVTSAVAVAAAPFAYITNSGSGTVSLIDLSTNTVSLTTIAVGMSSFNVAISPDGSLVYVSNFGSGTVSIISTATNTVIGTITVPGFSLPYGLAVSPNGTLLYVARSANGSVGVHNTTAPYAEVARIFGVGSVPRGIAVSPDGSRVVAATRFGGTYAAIINTSTNAVTTIGSVGGGTGVVISPDGTKAYVTMEANDLVAIVDLVNNQEAGAVFVGDGPVGVTLNTDGTRLYVTNSLADSVSVVDTGTNQEIGQIPVGDNPQGISLNPAGDRLYVVNRANGTVGTVSVVNLSTNPPVVEATLTVGSLPMSLGTFIHRPKVQYALAWVRPTNGSTTGVNAGSTVPVHWSITDVNGTAISDLAVVTEITSQLCANGSSTPVASARPRANSAGSSDLRYNTDHFMFNWRTDKQWVGQCRQFIVKLDDGSSHSLTFQFR